jgi:hypothetical protein
MTLGMMTVDEMSDAEIYMGKITHNEVVID